MSKLSFSLVNVLLLILVFSSPGQSGEKETRPARPLTFQVPKDWKTLDAGPLSLARFQVGQGDRIASINVTGLAGDGGGLAANINRWRTKVRLETVDESEALKSLQPFKIDGVAGHLLDLTGPRALGKPAERIVVAIVKKNDRLWFFNMNGPATLVGDQKAVFDEFLKSVQFEK